MRKVNVGHRVHVVVHRFKKNYISPLKTYLKLMKKRYSISIIANQKIVMLNLVMLIRYCSQLQARA